MTKTELAALGISEKDILEKLIDKLFDRFAGKDEDEDYSSAFSTKLTESIKKRIDDSLEKAIKKHIAPKIEDLVNGICLEETNRWGEKKGTKLTFIEYLVQRVDAYIREEVDYQGKAREQNWNSGSFTAKGTRIQHMVNEHLRWNVQTAMETAMKNATTSVSKGLSEACEIAIKNIQVKVNTTVESKI